MADTELQEAPAEEQMAQGDQAAAQEQAPPDAMPLEFLSGALPDIDPTNYANHHVIGPKAKQFIIDITSRARQDRQALQQEWSELYNIWDVRRDIYYYEGRSALYIPAGTRLVERAVAKQAARLFPAGDDFFDVKSIPPGEEGQTEIEENLDAAKALLWYDLHECLKIRQQTPIFLRQLNILGNSVSGIDYVTKAELAGGQGRRRWQLTPGKNGGPKAQSSPFRPTTAIGPTGRVVDMFTWYIWPPSCSEMNDAVAVFEDQLVTESTMLRWKKWERYLFDNATLRMNRGKAPNDSIWQASDRLQARGVEMDAEAPGALYVVTTLYADWNPDEDQEPIPWKFSIVNDELLVEARQNPFYHQSPPYNWARIFRYVDEAYGRGLIYFIRQMQYQINDTANQSQDALTYGLNPVVAVDPNIPDPSLLIWRPGAKWPVSPSQVKEIILSPQHRYGYENIRQLYELTQEMSGAATGGMYLPTLGLAKGADTATGQSLLVAASDIDTRLVTDAIEEDYFEPMLAMIDSMEQQFLPDHGERVLRALGRKGIPLLREGMRIRREQMMGTRTYTWTGGQVSEQREALQRAAPALLPILAKIPPTGDGRVNVFLAAKNIYRSFGFADAEEIFQTPGPGLDPAWEHLVMAMGHPLDPRLGEDHMAHLAAHDKVVALAKSQGWYERLKEHMLKTVDMARSEKTMPGFQGEAPSLFGPGAVGGAGPAGAAGGLPPGVAAQ